MHNMTQFSEAELEDLGFFLLGHYILKEKMEEFQRMPLKEVVRLAFVDWLEGEGFLNLPDPPENPAVPCLEECRS